MFLEQYIQGCIRSPGNVDIFQWNWTWFFPRHVQFDSGFNVMTVNNIAWNGPEIIPNFTIIPRWVSKWGWRRSVWFSYKITLFSSSVWAVPDEVSCSQILLSSRKLDCSICDWEYKDQKSPLVSPSYHDESCRGVHEDPSDSPRRFSCSSPLSGLSRIKVDVLGSCSPPESLTVPSATGNMNFFTFHWRQHFLYIESFTMDFRCVHLLQFFNVCDKNVSLPDSPCVQDITEEYNWQDFRTELMKSRWVFSRNRVIFYHCPKRDNWSVKWHREPPFIRCLPIKQEILNVSQMAVAIHGIRPPFFVQTRLQQYSRRTFFHSAHCSFSNSIHLGSMR